MSFQSMGKLDVTFFVVSLLGFCDFCGFSGFCCFCGFLAFVVVLDLNPSLNTCKYNTPHVYNLLYTIFLYMTYIYIWYIYEYMIYIYLLSYLILSYIILYYIILYCIILYIIICGIFKTLISKLKPYLNGSHGTWQVEGVKPEKARKGHGRKWWHLGRKGQRLLGSTDLHGRSGKSWLLTSSKYTLDANCRYNIRYNIWYSIWYNIWYNV